MYWLGLTGEPKELPLKLTAQIRGQVVGITSDGPAKLRVLLDDRLLDLDQEVTILVNGLAKFQGKVPRNLAGILKSTAGRGDPELVFPAEVILEE